MAERRARGRRVGGSGARAEILGGALAEFAERGYDAASLRGIARRAGVDPALVRYYFPGGKAELFAVALADRGVDPVSVAGELVAGGVDGLAARLVETVVGVWDEPGGREQFRVIFGAAASGSSATIREFLGREIFGRVATVLEGDDVETRVGLFASHVLGILVARHVLELEPIASMPPADLARRAAPTLQRYLDQPHLDPSP